MDEFSGSATLHMDAPAEKVFAVITDFDRLPTWNSAIESVAERPTEATVGAEWVVVIHPRRLPRWRSRSRIETYDPVGFRFGYRTRTDDNNPSYADWAWGVVPDGTGSQVTVSWEAHPKTLGRKLLAARIRRRMLETETAASLEALARVAQSA
jgi:uncharacterized protein YndB with AHSA1/START domain